MSLFKTKEIWTQSNHTEENFSVNSLKFFPSTDLISNIPYNDLILTTLLNEVPRLYNGLLNFSNEKTWRLYSITVFCTWPEKSR